MPKTGEGEVYLGGNREREEEKQSKAEAAFTLDLDKASSKDARALLARQQEQINELQRTIEKLINHGSNEILAPEHEVREFERTKANRAKYARLRTRHGLTPETIHKRCISILIHTSDDPRRNWPVHISINGHSRKLPRGIPTRVSLPELEVLDSAVQETLVPVGIETGVQGDQRLVFVQSYPYTLLEDSEIAVLAEAAA